ncbi:hypothetical protein [Ideonella livida]|uniref:Alpha/beta hydrolase n=1 Tax=Ideonella livida TaxID=2707176 RepID=A0A7C9PG15_9BURK|nr:hypothetical protein [Ideonella livida]NDY90955.1 hypothetical protein [Ideonella livida]
MSALDLAALQSAFPQIPAELPTQGQVIVDLDRGSWREASAEWPKGEKTQAQLYLCGQASAQLVVVCRPLPPNGAPNEGFWSALLGRGAHVLILEDFSKQFFGKGVELFGPDRAAMIAAVQRLMGALGTTELLCCASSGGGPGAIALAAALGGRRLALFSAATILTRDYYDRMFKERFKEKRKVKDEKLDRDRVARHRERMVEALGSQHQFDGRKALSLCPQKVQVRLHYPANLFWDRAWAEHLAGLEGVTLVPHEDLRSHAIAKNEQPDSSLADQELVGWLLQGRLPSSAALPLAA